VFAPRDEALDQPRLGGVAVCEEESRARERACQPRRAGQPREKREHGVAPRQRAVEVECRDGSGHS
jgi:hypothetical protein